MKNSTESSVHNQIHRASSVNWGSSEITPAEFVALKRFVKILRENNIPKRERRRNTEQYITNFGWPKSESITPKDYGEAAIAHACPIAVALINRRGEMNLRDTWESYTTKSQFDRMVHRIIISLISSERSFQSNGIDYPNDKSNIDVLLGLLADYNAPISRSQNSDEPSLQYPAGLDTKQVYGAGKLNRLWSANLYKNLAFIAQNKFTPTQLNALNIPPYHQQDKSPFNVNWSTIIEMSLWGATETNTLCANIAFYCMSALNLRPSLVAPLIVASYDPEQPYKNHGLQNETTIIWSKIFDMIQREFNSNQGDFWREMHQRLLVLIRPKLENIGLQIEKVSEHVRISQKPVGKIWSTKRPKS